MEWYNKYAIGIDMIDRQHQELIKIVDKVQKSISTKKLTASLGNALTFLAKYTQYHFKAEENLMEAVGYPEIDKHKALHKDLIQQITKILFKLKKGEDVPHYDLIDFFVDWIVTHIRAEDTKYGKFIEESNQQREVIEQTKYQDAIDKVHQRLNKLSSFFDQKIISAEECKKQTISVLEEYVKNINFRNQLQLKCHLDNFDELKKLGFLDEISQEKYKKSLAGKNVLDQLLTKIPIVDDQIKCLKFMFDEKLLDEDVYEKKKADILDNI